FVSNYWHLVGELISSLATFDIDNKLYPITTPHPLDESQPLPASIPYGLFFHYLHHTKSRLDDTVCRTVRDLALYMLAVCVCPPERELPGVAAPRSLTLARSGDGRGTLAAGVPSAPPLLMETLAMYALDLTRQVDEEARRMKADETNRQPQTLAALASCMLGLYNCIPHAPAAAMASAHLRAVSMAQFIRASTNPIVNAELVSDRTVGVPETNSQLFRCDRRLRLLELCSLTLSCVKLGLGIIELSWGACGYGSALVAKQEGGRDLIAFMIKHIVNHFGGPNRAMLRLRAPPWDKVLFKEGGVAVPALFSFSSFGGFSAVGISLFVAKLFLDACGYDSNLEIIEMLGGQRALLALSRYSEDSIMRQQATVLLTKMAVMVAKSGSIDDDQSAGTSLDGSMAAGQ
ncbi:hypothetical protein FOZ63_027626, partial [Perkinsus olseni]